jgi:hypothetical protein
MLGPESPVEPKLISFEQEKESIQENLMNYTKS